MSDGMGKVLVVEVVAGLLVLAASLAIDRYNSMSGGYVETSPMPHSVSDKAPLIKGRIKIAVVEVTSGEVSNAPGPPGDYASYIQDPAVNVQATRSWRKRYNSDGVQIGTKVMLEVVIYRRNSSQGDYKIVHFWNEAMSGNSVFAVPDLGCEYKVDWRPANKPARASLRTRILADNDQIFLIVAISVWKGSAKDCSL
jgi:hypothetical protein